MGSRGHSRDAAEERRRQPQYLGPRRTPCAGQRRHAPLAQTPRRPRPVPPHCKRRRELPMRYRVGPPRSVRAPPLTRCSSSARLFAPLVQWRRPLRASRAAHQGLRPFFMARQRLPVRAATLPWRSRGSRSRQAPTPPLRERRQWWETRHSCCRPRHLALLVHRRAEPFPFPARRRRPPRPAHPAPFLRKRKRRPASPVHAVHRGRSPGHQFRPARPTRDVAYSRSCFPGHCANDQPLARQAQPARRVQ